MRASHTWPDEGFTHMASTVQEAAHHGACALPCFTSCSLFLSCARSRSAAAACGARDKGERIGGGQGVDGGPADGNMRQIVARSV